MIKRRIITLLLFLAAALLQGYGQQRYENGQYRFSVSYGQGWTATEDKSLSGGSVVIFVSEDGNSFIKVDAVVSQKSPYKFRAIKRHLDNMAPEEAVLISERFEPFYDLLRNRIDRIYKYPGGLYEQQTVIIRNKTLFLIASFNSTGGFDAENEVIAGFDVKPSLWHKLNAYRSNAGWLTVSLLLTGFSLLGWKTRQYRDLFVTSGLYKNRYVGYVIATVVAFSLVFISAVGDIRLAAITVGVYLMLWSVFYSRKNFLIKFVEGMFSP